MTVKELINKYPFDKLIPYIVKHDSDAAEQITHYREAYDIMLHTEPELDRKDKTDDKTGQKDKNRCKDRELRISWDREWDEVDSPAVRTDFCNDEKWAHHLGKNLVIGPGISEMSAAAVIIRDMTCRGFSPEAVAKDAEKIYVLMDSGLYDNPDDINALYPEHKHKYNGVTKKRRCKWRWSFGPLRISADIEFDNDTCDNHGEYVSRYKVRRNHSRYLRNNRKKQCIRKLKHLLEAEDTMFRICEWQADIPYEQLVQLHDIGKAVAFRYNSRAYDVRRRMDYLWKSLSVYADPQKEPCRKTFILLRTSPKHLLTGAERKILDRIAALFGNPSWVTVYVGTDLSLGTEADLYIVRVRF